jgi:hypothetical protein
MEIEIENHLTSFMAIGREARRYIDFVKVRVLKLVVRRPHG